MAAFINFLVNNIFNQVAILIGIVAMIGLILQIKPVEEVLFSFQLQFPLFRLSSLRLWSFHVLAPNTHDDAYSSQMRNTHKNATRFVFSQTQICPVTIFKKGKKLFVTAKKHYMDLKYGVIFIYE